MRKLTSVSENVQNNSDSDSILAPGRRIRDGFAHRRAAGHARRRRYQIGNIRSRRLARSSNRRTNSIPNAARVRTPPTISLDSDSDDIHIEPQRPIRRPRIRRQILSDDDEVPRFHSSSPEPENRNQVTGVATGRQSAAYSKTNRTSQNTHFSSAATAILIECGPTGPHKPNDRQRERERSIPGAFPPSFSQSEASQSLRPDLESRPPSGAASSSYELPISPTYQLPLAEAVSPPSGMRASIDNTNRHYSPLLNSSVVASTQLTQVQGTDAFSAQTVTDMGKDARKAERKRQKRRRRQQIGAVLHPAPASQ